MAVYERRYKRYTGKMVPQGSRFLVLPRYAFKNVFKSRIFVAFFAVAFAPPLMLASMVYLVHNASFLELFPQLQVSEVLQVDASTYKGLMNAQGWLAFCVALFVGPGLVSSDLANNGLPLYLSRPFSRAEYVLGKLSVLLILLSALTWVAGLGLFALQSNLEGWGWMMENLRIAMAVFVGSWAWILVISLMALALSAWVKWRPIAGFLMLLIVVSGAFFGGIADALFNIRWGHMTNLGFVMDSIWRGLFGLEMRNSVPFGLAWVSLLGLAVTFLYLLQRKLKAYEVVG